MKQFNVKYPNGLTDQEVVSDCDTIEEYINRKFGSADPYEHGVEITMEDIVEENQAFAEESDHESEEEGETLTTKTANDSVGGTATETIPSPTQSQGITMNVDTGTVGAETQ